MDKLISVDAVKLRIGQDPNIDNDDFIGSAIIAAQSRFETFWGSPLMASTANVDKFRLDAQDNYAMQRHGLFRCKLRRGFVSGTPVVEYAGTWNADNVDWTAVTATDLLTDLEQGLVSIDKAYADNFVRITYDAGYALGATLPDWVNEVLLSLTPSMFATVNPTNRNPEAEALYKNLYESAMEVLNSHMRTKSLILRPI